jgi:hypothetical protein
MPLIETHVIHILKDNVMNTIRKYFKSIKLAEKYQNKLYDKYPYVRLIQSPIFTEDGIYEWHISI